MQQTEQAFLQKFKLNLASLTVTVQKYLCEALNCNDIVISAFPNLPEPFICSSIHDVSTKLSVKQLLELFIGRWEMEIAYQEEILRLKASIIQEFDQLGKTASGKNIRCFIIEERQTLVDVLLKEAQLDKKTKAGEFCKNLLNKFEGNILHKINECIFYVICTVFSNTLPVGGVEFIKSTFIKDINKLDEQKIKNGTNKIVQYVTNYFKPVMIQTNEFKSDAELKASLHSLRKNKKLCSLFASNLTNHMQIVEENKPVIEYVKVTMDFNRFMQETSLSLYNSLELTNINKEIDFQRLFTKCPKSLKEIKMVANKNEINQTSFNEVDFFVNLLPDGNGFELKTYLSNEEYCGEITYSRNTLSGGSVFSSNKFECVIHPKTSETEEKIKLLGNYFFDIEFLVYFKLDCWQAFIRDDGLKILSSILISAKNLNYLSLDFRYNRISNIGLDAISIVLKGMGNLTDLFLYFEDGKNKNHEITDAGLNTLSNSLKEAAKIKNLLLNFRVFNYNNDISGGAIKITDNGIEQLSKALKSMKKIISLKLYFADGKNKISDVGINFLSNSLLELNSIVLFYIIHKLLLPSYSCGENMISDKGMTLLAIALKQMSTNLNIDFNFRSGIGFKVTSAGENIIRNARKYKSIVFYKSLQQSLICVDFEVKINCVSDQWQLVFE